MAKKNADHVRMHQDGRFICRHCGDEQPMAMPIDIDIYVAASKVFLRKHKDCKPNGTLSVDEK